jgi:hypothetical protein
VLHFIVFSIFSYTSSQKQKRVGVTDTMTSRIAELGAQISSNSQKIDDYLAANSLPSPSFDENGPVKLNLFTEIESARSAVLNASAEL